MLIASLIELMVAAVYQGLGLGMNSMWKVCSYQ